MKILVIGTGVIGTTYGWQLSIAGHEVCHLIRKAAVRNRVATEGLRIKCLDLRNGKSVKSETIFRPAVVAGISDFAADLIIVSVNSNQISSLLPTLRGATGSPTILFMQNIRPGDDALIGEYIQADQYVIGYPFKAGGGRDADGIDTVIFGNALTHTMLGRPDGKITPKVREISGILKQADMAPKITRKIIPYIRTHYFWAAASIGAYMKAGSWERFLDADIVRESYLAMREGWNICRAQCINPLSVAPTRYFYLPLAILVPFTRRMYDDEGMRLMFEGHVRHSPDEMKTMFFEMLRLGVENGVDMPVCRGMVPFVNKYFADLITDDRDTVST
jgi:2-dehydropantoate 2-reductase